MESISAAAQDQAMLLEEINARANEPDHVTQHNAAIAEKTTAAAGSLRQKAAGLVDAVGRFRISRGNAAAGGRAATGRTASTT